MRTAQGGQSKAPNSKTPIGEVLPPGWASGAIIYARIGIEYRPDPNGPDKIIFKRVDFQARRGADLQSAITEIMTTEKYTGDPGYPPGNPAKPLGPLDIPVRERCYVLIHLDADFEWQFRTDGPAITTKDNRTYYNGQLRHVEKDIGGGYTANPGLPNGNGCRLAYFSIIYREPYESDYFNFHVELDQGNGFAIEMIVDPDIPNDGGTHIPLT